MARRVFASWIAVALITAAVLSGFTGQIAYERGWNNYLRLIQDGSTCQATITGTDSSSNCLATYSFKVGGRSYYGTGTNCSARVGQSVTVTYLVDDPSSSCLGSPVEGLANAVVSFLFGGLSFPEQS